jgi:hypothetical protein
VVGCIYLTHHREDIYPDPDEFRPERFLERRYSPYEYLPFGGVVRRCIGMAFARFEMKLVITGILSCFELALAGTRPVRPVPRSLTSGPSPFRMVSTNNVLRTTAHSDTSAWLSYPHPLGLGSRNGKNRTLSFRLEIEYCCRVSLGLCGSRKQVKRGGLKAGLDP